MTVGALYQIQNLNTNSANNFLEHNPQISFYKIVYRKHSRFAMENISFNNLSRSTLDYDENVIIKCDVPRNGDLLRKLYFTFELPNIYSGKKTTSNIESNYEFQWIKNIGINIFNYMTLKFNGQEIDKLYSDFIIIWKELNLSDEEKEIYNESIGNISELYDPKNGPGQNGNYPHITTGNTNTDQADKYSEKNIIFNGNNVLFNQTNIMENSTTYGDNIFPSILSRKIKVPLSFYFGNNSGLAIPLIALQYCVISLEFEMKKFHDLYTIIDAKYTESSNSFNKRIKPSSESHHSMDNFTNSYSYNINPNVEGEYIFLDENERKRFAAFDHEYLIEHSKISNKDGIEIGYNIEETSAKIYSAFNPVKYLTWVIKREDFKYINEWSNYTNWIYPNIPPYSNEYNYMNSYYNLTNSKNVFYDSSSHKSLFSTVNLKKNILTSVKLEFDGNLRIEKDSDYFSKQQMYQHFNKRVQDGIYVYSFSLNPLDYQPSGNCNFSNINNPKIYFKKELHTDSFTEHNYRAYVYVISYNILIIKNGNGNLKFVN
jgi:hypothetical protein